MARLIHCLNIDSTPGDLKSVDGNQLSQDDIAMVLSDENWGLCVYKLYNNITDEEDIPNIVIPSNNAEGKGWFLQPISKIIDDLYIESGKTLNVESVKMLSNENGIKIYDVNDNLLIEILDNLANFNISVNFDTITVDTINDLDTDNLILKDGSRQFTAPVSAEDPINDEHLTTKYYVDTKTESLSGNLEDYKDYIDDNFVAWNNTEVHVPSGDYNPATKKYVDNNIDSNISTIYSYLESNYLELDNVDVFTPTGNYNPATKLYVDETETEIRDYIDNNYIAFSNTQSFTPSDDYNPATKLYVDSTVADLDWKDGVLDRVDFTTSEPAQNLGDRYINTISGTSNITSQTVTEDYIYEWDGSIWQSEIPDNGSSVYVEDETSQYVYNGTNWVKQGSTFNHNNLSGLQGGTSDQYYHLTSNQYSNMTLNTDSDVSGNTWVLNEDNLVSDSDIKVPTQSSVKTYVDNEFSTLGSLSTLSVVTSGYIDSGTAPNGYLLKANGSGGVEWKSSSEAPIDSVFGRTGSVTAQTGDYNASQVTNDSSISGTNLDDALNNLNISDWDTSYNRSITGVSGSGNDIITISQQDGGNESTDLSHTHTNSEITDFNNGVDSHLNGGTDISYSNGTISHSDTSSQGNVNTSGETIIDYINLDGRGHVTGMGTRDLGSQSQYEQTISSSDPSGGSDGDVWYKV